MGRSCGFSALDFRSSFSNLAVCVASFLLVLVALPPEAFARARPLNATTVHARILKRGIDNPIAVELSNGVELMGRIIAINTDSFTMQLFNDPEPVTVNYPDVIDLRTGPSRGFWVFTGVAIGATVGFAIWGAVHMHNFEQENQLPNMPTPQPIP